jgi:hypothetical protein
MLLTNHISNAFCSTAAWFIFIPYLLAACVDPLSIAIIDCNVSLGSSHLKAACAAVAFNTCSVRSNAASCDIHIPIAIPHNTVVFFAISLDANGRSCLILSTISLASSATCQNVVSIAAQAT